MGLKSIGIKIRIGIGHTQIFLLILFLNNPHFFSIVSSFKSCDKPNLSSESEDNGDGKCIKLLKIRLTFHEAMKRCREEVGLTSGSQLSPMLTIESVEEQEMVDSLMFSPFQINQNFWLGVRRHVHVEIDELSEEEVEEQQYSNPSSNSKFLWVDGSPVEYSNWARNRPTEDETLDCGILAPVEIPLENYEGSFSLYTFNSSSSSSSSSSSRLPNTKITGKWEDVSCFDKHFPVCQKLRPRSQIQNDSKIKIDIAFKTDDENDGETEIENDDDDNDEDNDENESEKNEDNNTQKVKVEEESFNKLDKDFQLRMTALSEIQNNYMTTVQLELETLQKSRDAMESKFRTLEGNFNILQRIINTITFQLNRVPLSYVYTQYPDQPPPRHLWPLHWWKDITEDYAGLFFRAEGGASEDFGEVQADHTRQLTRMEYLKQSIRKKRKDGRNFLSFKNYHDNHNHYDIIKYYVSNGEVRPKNTAIRIWKRIL